MFILCLVLIVVCRLFLLELNFKVNISKDAHWEKHAEARNVTFEQIFKKQMENVETRK